MATETIKVGNQVLEIETRPITMVFQPAASTLGPRIEYPRRVRLDPEVTSYHAQRVQKLHTRFEECWRLFMANTTPPTPVGEVTAEAIRKGGGMGAIHLMGLIDMSLKFADMKVPVVWVFPESFLHPGWQVGLGDLLIHLTLGPGGHRP